MVSHHADDIPSTHGSEGRIRKKNPPGRVARCDGVEIRRAGQSHAMRHTAQQGATGGNTAQQKATGSRVAGAEQTHWNPSGLEKSGERSYVSGAPGRCARSPTTPRAGAATKV